MEEERKYHAEESRLAKIEFAAVAPIIHGSFRIFSAFVSSVVIISSVNANKFKGHSMILVGMRVQKNLGADEKK